MKHYMNIQRLKQSFSNCFEIDDDIVVQEKIDGANFSIKYDEKTNTIKSFSRKNELSISLNLRGAWEWSQKLDVDLIKKVLGNNLILFGEWLVKHSVTYPQDKYQNAYFYDVYDVEKEIYLNQEEVKDIISKLNLNYVPVLYSGKFKGWESLRNLIGKTEMGGEYGEGIVVKNQTKLNNPNDVFYTKIVCEQFYEKISHKSTIDIQALEEKERLCSLTETIVTKARIEKILHKFIDENVIKENWDETDMSVIAKNLPREIYCDCLKEEPEIVNEIGVDFGKFASKISMKITKSILNERNFYV